ncbi:MAG: hypothetical protein U1A28_00865, partial [Patescibacteria group bacterium]|nr:hypothetical protein [Patescibacteria group bacterium]
MKKILLSRSVLTVTLLERHEPDIFYRTREGLYVWSDFRDSVVVNASPTEAGTTFAISVADVRGAVMDWEIESVLSPSQSTDGEYVHLFDETTVCGLIAALLA